MSNKRNQHFNDSISWLKTQKKKQMRLFQWLSNIVFYSWYVWLRKTWFEFSRQKLTSKPKYENSNIPNETFFQTVCHFTWYVWFRKIRWKRMRLRGSIQGWSVGGSTFFECPCVNRVPQNAFELWCNTCLEASHAFGLCRTFLWTAQWAKILHSGWKSQKKSHSTFWATLTF